MIEINYGIYSDLACDGYQAFEYYKQNITKVCCKTRYKIIMTDIMMPIMDGYQEAEEIHKLQAKLREVDPTIPEIIIVAITAASSC